MSMEGIGLRQGVAMDSPKYNLGHPSLTILCLAGRPPLKLPYSHFKGGLPKGWMACGHFLLLRLPQVKRIWKEEEVRTMI
jgi:hypothetical protein